MRLGNAARARDSVFIVLGLWGILVAVAKAYLGEWAMWGSLALPFVRIFGAVVIDEIRHRPKRLLPSIMKQSAPVDHDRQSNEEEERRAELAALRRDIQNRSR